MDFMVIMVHRLKLGLDSPAPFISRSDLAITTPIFRHLLDHSFLTVQASEESASLCIRAKSPLRLKVTEHSSTLSVYHAATAVTAAAAPHTISAAIKKELYPLALHHSTQLYFWAYLLVLVP